MTREIIPGTSKRLRVDLGERLGAVEAIEQKVQHPFECLSRRRVKGAESHLPFILPVPGAGRVFQLEVSMDIWEQDSGRALGTQEHLRSIEDTVGQPFPAEYLDVIRTHNAAYFERQEFPVVTPDGPEDKSVAVMLSADGDEMDAESVLSQWRTLQDEHGLEPHVVPFGMDGGGNLVCFDFSDEGEPAIVFWQHDETWSPIRVADSFTSFLHQLS